MTADLALRDDWSLITAGDELAADVSKALGDLWAAVRQHNRAVPAVRIIVASRNGACSMPDWAALLPVIQVGTEPLTAGASDVLAWLLHQAAHALSASQGSWASPGRYHSVVFRNAAARVGLHAEMRPGQPGRGFTGITLQPGTALAYSAPLENLNRVLPA